MRGKDFRARPKDCPGGRVTDSVMLMDTPDEMLATAAAQGDRAAFATLVGRHYDRIHGLAWRLTGSKPEAEDLDTSRLWRRAMVGHAVSNVVPVVASNRIGREGDQTFYGHSFITNERGDLVGEFGADESGVLVATFDLAECAKNRAAFGFFRDRRPELYGRLVEDV